MKSALTLAMLLFLTSAFSALGQSVSHSGRSDGPSNSAITDALTCSPAPCVLQPIQASEGGNPVTDASIEANPLNPKQLLLGAQDTNCPGSLGFPLGIYKSANGGSTWGPPACMRPVYIYHMCCDPTVGYDRNGAAYVAGNYGSNDNYLLGLIEFEKSTDGKTWGNPATVISGSGFGSFDTPRLTIDTSPSSPNLNRLYVSTTAFLAGTGRTVDVIAVAHSSDGGATWTTKSVISRQGGTTEDEFSTLATGTDGTVYLTWQHCTSSNSCYTTPRFADIMFSKSTDGGNSWSVPTIISKPALAPDVCNCSSYGTLPNTSERMSNFPVIGVDNSTGPNAGNLHVVMYNWTGAYMQVQVVHSKDGGATWSKPVPVAPSTATHDQFFPWLSVSSTGVVGVSWLDRRNDPANLSYQAFAAVSTDGGKSFGTNWELTTALSNPNNDGSGGTYMGDYTGNTWVGNTLYAAWMDTSNGVTSQDVIGGLRLK